MFWLMENGALLMNTCLHAYVGVCWYQGNDGQGDQVFASAREAYL